MGIESGKLPEGTDLVAHATDLSKVYGAGSNAVIALNHVNVDFERGKMTAIMGASGSGKSTLMHCMAGLDSPSSGSIVVDEYDITHMTQRELTVLRRTTIGFIFQSFNLIPTLNAYENIVLPLKIAHEKIDKEWIDQIIDVTGLSNRLTHRPSELSGGQQQRVACARAFAAKPAVIFADEPTGNLDSVSSSEVLGFLRNSVESLGQSVVMVTHDPRAASYAHRVIVVQDGSIINDLNEPTYDDILAVFAQE
jgi:putative ABC transport system ATP-binding protein